MDSARSPNAKTAVLYRMLMPDHQCPFGQKTKHLLRRHGYHVDDQPLRSREAVDAFKEEHDVTSTPQVFIDGQRVGGYEAVRRYVGKPVKPADEPSYRPVIVLFILTFLMATATSLAAYGAVQPIRTAEWFIAFSMVVLALLKLQDVESFSTMFLNYDLLAQRWVPYATFYPYAEGLAGILMVAGILHWLSVPLALFIGSVGAVSVFKAVYVDRRSLKCACVGGSNAVPLGFVSLTENLMMIAMALWMGWTAWIA